MGYDINELMQNKIGLDETFDFGCLECGNCCRNRDTLIITGYDLFRIAKYLVLTTEQVLNKYCFGYIGHDSKLPIVSLKFRSGDNTCPFLRKGKCTINEVKPIVCEVYPLGRMYDSNSKEYIYFTQPEVGCGNKQKHTVRDWLKNLDIEEVDVAGKEWGNALIDLAMYVRDIKDRRRTEIVRQAIVVALYINYDIKKDYTEELRKNLKALENILPGLKRGKI